MAWKFDDMTIHSPEGSKFPSTASPSRGSLSTREKLDVRESVCELCLPYVASLNGEERPTTD
jgi:hypothetical protein